MTTWYEFRPADTLFFKGARPMVAGQDHTATTVFPPMPSTIQGAIRTAVLSQNRIDTRDYYKGRVDDGVIDAIGQAGQAAPFSVVGPLMKWGRHVLIPVPALWFLSSKRTKEDNKIYLVEAKRPEMGQITITSSVPDTKFLWAKQADDGEELKPAQGLWMPVAMLNDNLQEPVLMITDENVWAFSGQSTQRFVVSLDALIDREQRTGIKMDPDTRGALKGHLYSFTHVRFRQGVSLVFGIDRDISGLFRDAGVLQLGGEQRFGHYKRIELDDFPADVGDLWLALSPIKASDQSTAGLIASGKVIYTGGWDLKRGFHKPLSGYYPQGSVFDSKLGNQQIGLRRRS